MMASRGEACTPPGLIVCAKRPYDRQCGLDRGVETLNVLSNVPLKKVYFWNRFSISFQPDSFVQSEPNRHWIGFGSQLFFGLW